MHTQGLHMAMRLSSIELERAHEHTRMRKPARRNPRPPTSALPRSAPAPVVSAPAVNVAPTRQRDASKTFDLERERELLSSDDEETMDPVGWKRTPGCSTLGTAVASICANGSFAAGVEPKCAAAEVADLLPLG
eukprot:6200484-Pleurochrysis_carterae.AAC.3